jgi:hypothetical protein
MCGFAFFGADHLLFGIDMPLGDMEFGNRNYRQTINAIEEMGISDEDRMKIYEHNAKRAVPSADQRCRHGKVAGISATRTWDLETDVVVVGHGYAGAVCAINVHDHGAEVLVLEKESHPAGCLPAAGGDIGCIIGDVDEAFTYFKALCGAGRPMT